MTGAICSDTQSEQASDMILLPIHFPLTSLAHSGGGSGGILQLRQSLLSSRFALALFCIHKLEKQFAVCFILAHLQNGLFSLYALGRQLF